MGITLNVKQETSAAWFNTLYSHPTPMGMQVVSWVPDYPDPADAAALIYNSAFATKNSFNTANYKNPKMDALLAKQQGSVNNAVRATAIKGILSLGAADLPYIPVWYDDIGMALNSKYKYSELRDLVPLHPLGGEHHCGRLTQPERRNLVRSGPADENTQIGVDPALGAAFGALVHHGEMLARRS